MLELQADLSASGVNGGEPSDPADQMKQAALYVAALRTLAAWNGDAGGGGLLHPTLPQRIRFIRRMLHNPRSAARFHRRIQLAGTALAAVVVASLVVLVSSQPG